MKYLIPSACLFFLLFQLSWAFARIPESSLLDPAPTLSQSRFCTRVGTPFGEADRPNVISASTGGNFIWYGPTGVKIGSNDSDPNNDQPFSNSSQPELDKLGINNLTTPGSYTYKVRVENAGGTALSDDAMVTYVVLPDLSTIDLEIGTLNDQLNDQITNSVCINNPIEFNSDLTFSTHVIDLLEPTFTIRGTVFGNIFLCILFGIDCPRTIEIVKNEYPLNLSNLQSELEPGVVYTIDLEVKDCDGSTIKSSNDIDFELINTPTSDILFPDIIYCPQTDVQFTIPIQPQFTPANGFNYVLNFGDNSTPVVIDNNTTLTNDNEFFTFTPPPHQYQKTGEYDLLLSVIDLNNPTQGCNFNWAKSIRIGNPVRFVPEFALKNFRKGDPKGTDFELNNASTLLFVNKTWLFGYDGDDADTNTDFEVRVPSDSRIVNYPYTEAGTYTVNLSMDPQRVDLGATDFLICPESYLSNLTIFEALENIDTENGYSANDDAYVNWVPSQSSRAGEVKLVSNTDTIPIREPFSKKDSWKLITPTDNNAVYPEEPEKGQKFAEGLTENAWATLGVYNSSNQGEVSWIESPFISLKNFQNPFVSFQLWYDTPARVDGLVFQYTLGNQEIWYTLGTEANVGDSSRWFNERGIAALPGTQDSTGNNLGGLGWSGFSDGWKVMRFPLDSVQTVLMGFPEEDRFIRFRFAYSSLENSPDTSNLIAIQGFKILEADRIVLWELFHPSLTDTSAPSPVIVQDPFALYLHYYTNPEDSILYRNSAFESSISALRELYYGIGSDQLSVMDGKRATLDQLESEFIQRKLDFTAFSIQPVIQTNPLSLNCTLLKKTQANFPHELRLRMALIKRGVEYNQVLYQNVVRRFIPLTQGIRIPNHLNSGDTFTLPEAIPFPDDLDITPIQGTYPGVDVNDLNNRPYLFVVFIQDIETKEILQCNFEFLSELAISEGKALGTYPYTKRESPIRLYPNPGDNYVHLDLAEEKVHHWFLQNAWGDRLEEGFTDQSTKKNTLHLKTAHLPSGYYLLFLERKDHPPVIKRFLVIH